MKKVLFISSSGGHLAELLQMKELFQYYQSYLVTEKDSSTKKMYCSGVKQHFLLLARRENLFFFILKNLLNIGLSACLFLRRRPDVIVSTGANTAVPMCYIAKIFGRKVIFIETFASSKKKTLSGILLYPIANAFFVQWESMLNLYPKAIYKGALY